MKVCDLTQFYSPVSGGVRRYIEQKAAFVRRHCPGDEHILIVPGEKTGRAGDEVSRCYTIESPLVSRTSRYRALLALHLVEEVLESEKPDIIESGDPYQVAWKAVASGRALGIPVVGFYHSHFPEAYLRSVAKYFGKLSLQVTEEVARRYVRFLYNRFECTMTPSPALGGVLREWGVECVENIDLGVDVAVFRPDAAGGPGQRRALGIRDDTLLLLYVGRLAPEKNVKTLLRAFEMLSARQPGKYHLLAVGDGSQRSSVLRLRDRLGEVTWLPFCSDARELAALYRAADIFVHPGIQETFGLVALESQACGTPVIGIRGSYMDRIIFSNQMHWADSNTPEGLAAAIEQMSASDFRSSGTAAAQTVLDRYSWESVFRRLFGVYHRVIDGYND